MLGLCAVFFGAITFIFWAAAESLVRTGRKHQPKRTFEAALPIQGRWLNYLAASLLIALGLVSAIITLGCGIFFVGLLLTLGTVLLR